MAPHGRRRSPVPPHSSVETPPRRSRPRGKADVGRKTKKPFDEDAIFARIEEAIRPFNKAATFELHEQGYTSVFELHRVTNRWGYVSATTPEKSLAELEARLPKKHWIDINRLLVPFGNHICTGKLPKCSTCPVLAYCRQVGAAHR